MRSNISGSVKAVSRGLSERMSFYDDLPTEYRRLLQEAPYNIHINPHMGLPRLALLREQLATIKKKSILDTYGPDHPNLENCGV